MSEPVEMPHPLVEAFGRPTWREYRARLEARTLGEAPAAAAPSPGTPVLIAPGFLGSERSVAPLTGWLAAGGYDVTVAPVEANLRGSAWAVDRIIGALEARPPALLIGHSRGGQQARVATQLRPDLVAGLITLGAPFRAHIPQHFVLRATVETMRFASRFGLFFGDDGDDADYAATLAEPFDVDVPFTSIWSRSDGFVAWQSCADTAAIGVEVDCSHRGLIASKVAFSAIASALAGVTEPAGADA